MKENPAFSAVIGALIGWLIIVLFPFSTTISTTHGEAQIYFSADRTIAVWPTNCAKLHWKVDQIQAVYLNDVGIVGEGQAEQCFNNKSEQQTLKVKFRDGIEQEYALTILVLGQSILGAFWTIVMLLAYYTTGSAALRTYLRPLAIWERRCRPYKGYFIMVVVISTLAVGLLSRAFRAFSTDKVLNWDETYYASIAVTGAHGLGLYPYVQNLLPTQIMTGIGYMAYQYVLGVQIFGPTIYSLRLVSLIVGVVALIPIYLTLRLWYGPATGLVGVALTPLLLLYQITNTIKMDTIAIAFVGWTVFLVAFAFQKQSLRWHWLAGLIAGLALQAHVNTFATAFACGLLYLITHLQTAYRTRGWLALRSPLSAYLLGCLVGFGIYVVLDILPDAQGFFRTASAIRATALGTGNEGAASFVQSYVSPLILIPKELGRYTGYLVTAPYFETWLFLLGILALLIRRTAADKKVLVLCLGALIGGAIIFNNSALIYLSHISPILMLPLAPLITHGFDRQRYMTSRQLSFASITMLIIAVAFLAQPNLSYIRSAPRLFVRSEDMSEIVSRIQHLASTGCRIAADPEWYVPYFLDYPLYNSTGLTEETLGIAYLGGQSGLELWSTLRPDIAVGPLSVSLRSYVQQAHYKEIEPDIWLKTEGKLTDGCVITANKQPEAIF